ncbi:MAG TPA: hypothetical protein RMF84_01030 [Polyangiaceae bacterium LLY-WYZ-14_1]|jgi:hypothetical protein|nr:hypothetical protein [Polyangiaceae bacterium LLY-WYZ-14_1]
MARGAAKGKAAAPPPPATEEIPFRSDNAFLCLLLNRRAGLIRVIDFRAGAIPAKRLFIQSIAKREGVEKVITLVEKDEVSSWTRVGFVREGTIPGFYKRSDGHLCGCVISDKTASIEVTDDAQRHAERTVNAAKKGAKELEEVAKKVATGEVDEVDALTARDDAWGQDGTLGSFEAFGREAERTFFQAKMPRGKANFIQAEYQDCFGHSLVEPLRSPTTDNDVLTLRAGLETVGEWLKDRGIISAFGFGPIDDVPLATAYVAAGFRKTGLLAKGVQVGEERRDAILWTRKLANPGGDDAD